MLHRKDLIDLQPVLHRITRGDEDALQDTNLRLLQRAPAIREADRYAARTARRCRTDATTRNRWRCEVPLATDALILDASPGPDELAWAAEERARLRCAIGRLSARQREAIENPCRANNSMRYKALRRLRRSMQSGLTAD